MTYFDHNATAPLRLEAKAAMLRAMDIHGNPSSVHAVGRAARTMVEKAREQVAGYLRRESRRAVIFTSGGAESNGLALRGAVAQGALDAEDRITRLFVVATAHDSVRGVAADLSRRKARVSSSPRFR